MKGRKPKPTARKLLEGNPGKRPLPRHEPKPAKPAALTAPRYLDRLGREAWRTIVPELDSLGLLTVLDAPAIARWCDLWARWRRARLKLRDGFTDAEGRRKPEAQIVKDCELAMLRIETEFGMTASARTRVQAEPPAPPLAVLPGGKDPARFFRREAGTR
jgi:P27 family predicted phage terminase small subunit